MSQKVINTSKTIDPVINGFSHHDESSHFHRCDQSIFKFGIRKKCIGFSKISHVDTLYKFRRSVVYIVKWDICILQKGCDSKGNNMKIQYAKKFVHKLGMGDPTTCVYHLIFYKKDKNDTQIA